MESNLFIKILELGEKANGNRISLHDVGKLCHQENFLTKDEFDKIEPILLGKSSFKEQQQESAVYHKYRFFNQILTDNFVSAPGGGHYFLFKTDGYFKLIEYRELKLARENSESARKQSMCAILLSILSLIAAIVLGIIQLNQDITIDPQQLETTTDSIRTDLSREQSKLNEMMITIDANKIDSLSIELDSTGRHGHIYR